MAGRKPQYQLQYLVGSDGEAGCEPEDLQGEWALCVSDAAAGGNSRGPASKAKAVASLQYMQGLYPSVNYRVINIKTQEVVA